MTSLSLSPTPHAKRTALWAGYFFALALPLVGAALLQVSLRQQAISLGYRLSHAEQRRELLRGQIRKAELERAAGRTPIHLGQVATKLGMVPPTPAQLLSSNERPPVLRPVPASAAPAAKKPPAAAHKAAAPQARKLRAPTKPAARPAPRNRGVGT